jgi:predicted AlkP superfamily phosphohydrolase/phosphomutase
MGVITNIQLALETPLRSLQSNVLDIAFPNIKFTSTINKAFLRPTLIPATTDLYTLNGQHRYSGIYQIDIIVPLNRGLHQLNDIADTVLELYSLQSSLIANSTIVHIQNISPLPTQRDESYFQGGVQINFLSYN